MRIAENAARALSYAHALATGEGAMLIAAHIIQESATDGPEHEPASGGYAEDPESKITNVVGGLSRDAATRF